jgi:hypothetical protein
MAALALNFQLNNGSISTIGSANAHQFTSGVGYTSIPTGLRVTLRIGVTNTGSATLNMDGIGAVTILDRRGAVLTPNLLLVGAYETFIYNGTNWILMDTPVQPATPTIQIFTSGTGTYTTPLNARAIVVEMVGGGGAGGGSFAGTGFAGDTTGFGALACAGGQPGLSGSNGNAAGGYTVGGDVTWSGAAGQSAINGGPGFNHIGGSGGASYFGGAGAGGATSAGINAIANTGSGGGGATSYGISAGSGGGAGAYLRKLITGPAATYSYAVGAGGGVGTTNAAGGAGAAGIIIVTEFY